MMDYFRPGLERLLWNRKRVIVMTAVSLIVLIIAGHAVALAARHGASPAGPARARLAPPVTAAPVTAAPAEASASAASTPAASIQAAGTQPAAPPSPQPARPAPATAAAAGTAFTAAWADHAAGWQNRVDKYATPRLAAQLAGTNPVMLPATRVTGPARVTGQAPGTVDLSIPTDAGPALVTVRLTGGRWLADSVLLARTGD